MARWLSVYYELHCYTNSYGEIYTNEYSSSCVVSSTPPRCLCWRVPLLKLASRHCALGCVVPDSATIPLYACRGDCVPSSIRLAELAGDGDLACLIGSSGTLSPLELTVLNDVTLMRCLRLCSLISLGTARTIIGGGSTDEATLCTTSDSRVLLLIPDDWGFSRRLANCDDRLLRVALFRSLLYTPLGLCDCCASLSTPSSALISFRPSRIVTS